MKVKITLEFRKKFIDNLIENGDIESLEEIKGYIKGYLEGSFQDFGDEIKLLIEVDE